MSSTIRRGIIAALAVLAVASCSTPAETIAKGGVPMPVAPPLVATNDDADAATPPPIYVTDEGTYLANAVPNVTPPTILVVKLSAGPMLVDADESLMEMGPAERCATYGGEFRVVVGEAGDCEGVDY